MKANNSNLLEAIRITREMMALADEGDRDRNDDSCGIIYGVLRDAAYRIRKLAETECEKHKAAGKWDFEEGPTGPNPAETQSRQHQSGE